MAQSWCSPVKAEIDSADMLLADAMESTYPELINTCKGLAKSDFREMKCAFTVLSYRIAGGTDTESIIRSLMIFKSMIEGLELHAKIDDNGKVIGSKKKLFSKSESATKIIVAGDYLFAIGLRYGQAKEPKAVPYIARISKASGEYIFRTTDLCHNASLSEEDAIGCLEIGEGEILRCLSDYAMEVTGADSTIRDALTTYALNLGAAMQIMEDMEDIMPKSDKPVCSTLQQGIPTLPLFYAMQDPEVGVQAKKVFTMNGSDAREMASLITSIGHSPVKERCLTKASEYAGKAVASLDGVNDSEYKQALLEMANVFI